MRKCGWPGWNTLTCLRKVGPGDILGTRHILVADFLSMPLSWYSSSTKPYNTLATKTLGQTALNISFGVTSSLSCFFFFINTPVRLLQRSCWLIFSAAVSEKWLLWGGKWHRVCASAGEKPILLLCIFSFPTFDWLNYHYLAILNWKKLLGLVCGGGLLWRSQRWAVCGELIYWWICQRFWIRRNCWVLCGVGFLEDDSDE